MDQGTLFDQPGDASRTGETEGTAAAYLPERLSLSTLREAAAGCKACDLWKTGTQTVFGEGAESAEIVFVGEQPGDKEDLEGRPFVGPAGRVLDEGLEADETGSGSRIGQEPVGAIPVRGGIPVLVRAVDAHHVELDPLVARKDGHRIPSIADSITSMPSSPQS